MILVVKPRLIGFLRQRLIRGISINLQAARHVQINGFFSAKAAFTLPARKKIPIIQSSAAWPQVKRMVHSKLAMTALIVLGVLVGIAVLRLFLRWLLPAISWIKSPKNIRQRVLVRYQGKDFHAWMFARCKTAQDKMFTELPEILKPVRGIRNFLDVGCGFGIAGCFLLEHFENSTAYAIEPSASRVRAAAAAMGPGGHVYQAMAPDFEQPDFPARFDIVFALDMTHFLSDAMLDLTLKRIRNRLDQGQYLIIRNPVLPAGRQSFQLKMYKLAASLTATYMQFRTVDQIVQRISKAGFDVATPHISGTNPELYWFIATALPVTGLVQKMEMAENGTGGHRENGHDMNQNQPAPIHGGELVQLLQRTQSA